MSLSWLVPRHPTGCFDRLLRFETEVDATGHQLQLDDRLTVPTHGAEHCPRTTTAQHHRGDEGMQRSLARLEDVR
ncbi:hypothetical protein HRbin27_00985 [bacterium HR27]|nr:hypothetical protein HRbin27_00985 [bacterium HR27]